MNKHNLSAGFSVLEVIVSIAISAFLLTASLVIYNQINKTGTTITKIIQTDTQAIILYQQLKKDLQGIMPLWFNKEIYAKINNKKYETNPTKENNFLYATSSNNTLDFITFVSTNALYFSPDKPIRVARVAYWTKPDESNPAYFTLFRTQETKISSDIDIETLKKNHSYPIAHNIKQCIIEYGYPEKKDGKTKMKYLQQWGQKQELEKKEQEKKESVPNLPNVIKIIVTIADNAHKTEKEYEMYFEIPASSSKQINSFAQIRAEKTKSNEPKKPEQVLNENSENKGAISDATRSK